MIAIIDYSMGNLRSVQKGFENAGVGGVAIARDAAVVSQADGLVLPGVGAYRDAMLNLKKSGLLESILEKVEGGTPLLGICLGMQLLMDSSLENGDYEGLGLVSGVCRPIPRVPGIKIPHIGWNTVDYPGMTANPLFEGVPRDSAFYFVHSYYCDLIREPDVIGRVEYGSMLPCALNHGNLYGVQFHPEKSSTLGLRMLSNFGAIVSGRSN